MSAPGHPLPASTGAPRTVTEHTVTSLCEFADAVGFRLIIGLDGGFHPGVRNASNGHAWMPSSAEPLLGFLASNSICARTVAGFELTNEPNLFLFNQGHFLSGEQLAKDFRLCRSVIDTYFPAAMLGGPDTAFQLPLLGELFPTFHEFLETLGDDVVNMTTWHWYALESSSCPLKGKLDPASLPASVSQHTFNAGDKYQTLVQDWTRQLAPSAEIWLGEMSLISCGGQAGISDRLADSFWYLSQLGRLAAAGQTVVCRQSLVSTHYGLMDHSLFQHPDFYAAVLFNRLMGTQVLGPVTASSNASSDNPFEVFAHVTPSTQSSLTILIVNASPTRSVSVTNVTVGDNSIDGQPGQLYHVTGTNATHPLSSVSVSLNKGPALAAGPNGTLPALSAVSIPPLAHQPLLLSPASYAFLVLPIINGGVHDT